MFQSSSLWKVANSTKLTVPFSNQTVCPRQLKIFTVHFLIQQSVHGSLQYWLSIPQSSSLSKAAYNIDYPFPNFAVCPRRLAMLTVHSPFQQSVQGSLEYRLSIFQSSSLSKVAYNVDCPFPSPAVCPRLRVQRLWSYVPPRFTDGLTLFFPAAAVYATYKDVLAPRFPRGSHLLRRLCKNVVFKEGIWNNYLFVTLQSANLNVLVCTLAAVFAK